MLSAEEEEVKQGSFLEILQARNPKHMQYYIM
jgi:hypothetical protein